MCFPYGERGTGDRGTGNGERGTGNGERGTGNGERGRGRGRGTGTKKGTGTGAGPVEPCGAMWSPDIIENCMGFIGNYRFFSARWRAPVTNTHHGFGALARASRKYSAPFRRAGARQSQIFTTGSARWRAPVANIHHRFGALARACHKYYRTLMNNAGGV